MENDPNNNINPVNNGYQANDMNQMGNPNPGVNPVNNGYQANDMNQMGNSNPGVNPVNNGYQVNDMNQMGNPNPGVNPVNNGYQPNTESASQANEVPKKNMLPIIIGGVAALIVLGVVLYFVFGSGASSKYAYVCNFATKQSGININATWSIFPKKSGNQSIDVYKEYIISKEDGSSFSNEELNGFKESSSTLIGISSDIKNELKGNKVYISGTTFTLAYSDAKEMKNNLVSEGFNCR